MKTYKLWIHIEEYDYETDKFKDCTDEGLAEPVPVGRCDTLEGAIKEAETLGEMFYEPELILSPTGPRKLKSL